MHHHAKHSQRWWVAIVCITLPLLAAIDLGQDANWDLANYHLYNPHAWLNDRYSLDIAAAQLQSWHNPVLDLPLYLLVRKGAHGALITLWLTVPAMVALFAGVRLLEGLLDRPARPWEVVAFSITAISAPTMYSTLGSSMNDGFVAAGMVSALLVVSRPDLGWRSWLMSGAIAGATAGLKLSAMPYCFGLIAAALVARAPRSFPMRISALAVGGLVGFTLAYGAWGLRLWEAHGNPFFPYFNNVFHSPDVASISWTDKRFRPQGILEALSTPVRLLFSTQDFSEIAARTPLPLIGLLVIASLRWLTRNQSATPRQAAIIVAAFFVSSFLVWAVQSGILRYTSPLEIIAPALLLTALARLPGRTYSALACILTVLIFALSERPNWGRQPFQRHLLSADWPKLPARSIVLRSDGEPMGYFALGLPRNVPIIAIRNNFQHPLRCQGLQLRAEDSIRAHRGPIWLLERDSDDADVLKGRQIARRFYGLVVGDGCIKMRSTFGPIRLCPLARTRVPRVCDVDR